MLKNGKPLRLTCEEGNALLLIACNFNLPEKLGDTPYNVADRAIAGEEVRELYRELLCHSPMHSKPEKWNLFGPEQNWRKVQEDGQKSQGFKMIDKRIEIDLTLTEKAESGVVWCLIVALHPASVMVQTAGTQEDLFWPIAQKLRRVGAVQDIVGLDRAKAAPRRWKHDDDEEAAPKEETKKVEKKDA